MSARGLRNHEPQRPRTLWRRSPHAPTSASLSRKEIHFERTTLGRLKALQEPPGDFFRPGSSVLQAQVNMAGDFRAGSTDAKPVAARAGGIAIADW